MAFNLKNAVCSRFYINFNNSLKNTVLLAGTGRSGTTWISNIINYDNEYRDIFEPFSTVYTKECHGFAYKQYLRENDDNEYFLKTARMILSGRVGNKWIDQYNRLFFCKKRLVKDIRLNFLLKWIRIHFPEIPIVFLIRHPIAVAHSRLRLGWDTHLEKILSQDELIEDFFQDTIDIIRKSRSKFERQIYLWCIENYVPLKTLSRSDAYFACYESFCIQPEKESRKLLHWIGKGYDQRLKSVIGAPSKVSSSHSAVNTGDDLVCNWKKEVTQTECNKAVDILSLFGMDHYYTDDPLPVNLFPFSDLNQKKNRMAP